ncbi:phosphoribosyl-AMP cyclohydrolase [candidate division KSB1 bacterium]|nr:phosphoribosyl-AMP cyclohydrolase [candidate division KSB1 bacterium]
MSNIDAESGKDIRLDFQKLRTVVACSEDVIPVIAQDTKSGRVLIVGYANQMALEKTLKSGKATFWSTSRDELWVKGESSGDVLLVDEVRVNCEQNALLYLCRLRGEGACHTRNSDGKARLSCFYRRIDGDALTFVDE